MSSKSSFIKGYGFHCSCAEDKIIELIQAHRDTFCKSVEELELYEKIFSEDFLIDLIDDFATYECECNGSQGIWAAIANIMSRETGIRFLFCPADDACGTEESIIFQAQYPWELNKTEKKLTAEKLDAICISYMDELGINGTPDYLELEYYG